MSIELLKSILNNEDNLKCFECRYKNSSWACSELCIFLCIDCAHLIKSASPDVVMIKSLTLATWAPEEILKLQNGGNHRLRSLMLQYRVMNVENLAQKYSCKAVQYYKELINAEMYKFRPPEPPAIEEGAFVPGQEEESWWSRTKNSIFAFGGLRGSVAESIGGDAVGRIRNSGVSAFCGLRELAYSSAKSAFVANTEGFQPDYVKMEEPLNRDNSK